MVLNHRIRYTAALLVLSLALLVSLTVLPPAARDARAATGWERQASGVTDPLCGVSAVSASAAWGVGNTADYNPFVLKTTDGGHSWVRRTFGVQGSVSAVDAASAGTVFATGQEITISPTWPYLPVPVRALVFKTADGGNTWTPIETPVLPNQHYPATYFDVEAINAGTVLVVGRYSAWGAGQDDAYNVICRTNDGGATWTVPYIKKMTTDISPVNPMYWSISAAGSNAVYARVDDALLKSTDAGASWNTVLNPDYPGKLIRLAAADANTVWALSVEPSLGGYILSSSVMKTTDGGNTWSEKLEASGMTIAAASPDVAWAVGGQNIFKTTDGGATWRVQAYDPATDFVGEATAYDSLNAWAVDGGGMILHTSDGGGAGLPLTSLESVAPGSGAAGSEVVLKGKNFGANQGTSYAGFYHISNTGPTLVKATGYTLWSDTEIRCTVPALAPQQTLVHVQTYNRSNLLPFTVAENPAPVVTSINPSRGMNTTTYAVEVLGANLQSGASIKLVQGTTVIKGTGVVLAGPGRLTCYLDLKSKPLGKYDVLVKNPDGQEGKLAGGFTVVNSCGQGAGAAVSVMAGLLGLLSVAGLRWKRRRKG